VNLPANAERFSGFADLYDDVRPVPPAALGEVLTAYAGGRPGLLVDLGSGTGLSSRWAATWADEVVGVEPSGDMRARAGAATAGSAVRFVEGWSTATGLGDGCADVVLAVQSLHWMDPAPTFAEIARILRPGGVFAAIDCDWPPSIGHAGAEAAWQQCRARVRAYERRLADGLRGAELVAPLTDEERNQKLPSHFSRDPNKRRTMALGVKAWSKDEHLDRIAASGRFAFWRELCVLGEQAGSAARFVDVLRSQGDLQAVLRHGVSEEALGVTAMAAAVRSALGEGPRRFWWTYRARIGVMAS
jgi:SAM-dependent methyltransferase